MKTLHTCPSCTKGKITITMEEWGKPETKTETIMNCLDCDGSGEVSQEDLDDIEYEKNMWCKCDGDTPTKFYDDGVHPEISKHHWRCKPCGKVKQIG